MYARSDLDEHGLAQLSKMNDMKDAKMNEMDEAMGLVQEKTGKLIE
jgi:hypothetical protein